MLGRKGISPIIGAAMMFALLLVSFSVIIWQIRQMDDQQQKANVRNEDDLKRIAESIEITNVKITDSYRLNCSVLNKGPLTVQLADLFVIQYNSSRAIWEKLYAINYTLNPGNTALNIGNSIPLLVYANNTYSVRVVTARGSSAVAVFVPPPPNKKMVGPLTFSIDYLSFNYTTSSDGTYYTTHSRPAWEMVGGKDGIIWWLKLTNNGNQSLSINASSYLMIYVPWTDTGEDENYFYIVDNRSTSTTLVAYTTPIIIPANTTDPTTGVSRTLKFGSKTKGGTISKMLAQPDETYNSYRRFLYCGFVGLCYRWATISQDYGLSIPLSTQKVYPYSFSVSPQWLNPVQRPASGTLTLSYTYNLKSYQFSNTVTVSVSKISGPGTISYDTGPWSNTLSIGTNYTSAQRHITVSSSTVPGTYVFQVSSQYPSYPTIWTQQIILLVT